ncbi:MAG: discoidin domain-containing protein [Tannerella sp.]|jgi:hypothetical protein|nr:discoidin domain-containing protein [Tannerella sp.]
MKNAIILFVICAVSCTRFSPEIEAVLQQAGNNRSELAQVLKHYGRDPADSLKLRAAEFLIVNMPGKYSEYYDAPWENVATACLRWSSSSDQQLIVDTYHLGEPVRRDDVKYITAGYLIDNIDLAFRVWEEQPWGKHIPFDLFCEEILPYRISTEPLENWRERALASFADLNRSFKEQPVSAVEACSKVNSLLPRFRMDKDFPVMSYSQMMTSSRGPCESMAALAAFTMRALGIPVTVDFTPQWSNKNTGHTWNSVSDSTGKHISFMGAQSNPGKSHQGVTWNKSKVYRHTFARQQNGMEDNILPEWLNAYITDVSSEYKGFIDVDIDVRVRPEGHTGHVYLTAMGEAAWNPVGCGQTDSQKITFSSIGVKNLYLPVYYIDSIQVSAHDPFWLRGDSAIHFFSPDTSNMQQIALTKFEPSFDWNSRMRRGVFEGANRSDFSDAQRLYTIQETPETCFHEVVIDQQARFRYVRYLSPPGASCNVAEIEFYGTDTARLQGTVIGTPGAWGKSSNTCDKVFDGDPVTYYDAAQKNDAWTGLDLDKPKRIGKIRFLPRNDGNILYPSRIYELFCWNGENWQSLGKETATDNLTVSYKVPANALFYIEELSEKNRKATHVFTINNKKQQWM